MLKKITLPWILLTFAVVSLLFSCASPVVRTDLLERGIANPLMSDFLQSPDTLRNRLFILGGTILSTRYTEEGFLIEALYVSVNSLGYLQSPSLLTKRFLAIFPIEKGVLDPFIYSKDKGITVAGVFLENRIGFIDDASYTYPTFIIEDMYLWEQRNYYTYPYPPLFFSIGGFSYGRNWGFAPSFSFGW